MQIKKLTAKDFVLSFQHMFAMLGATITVPLVVGMSVPLALLSAGIGSIIFYFLTKRKVPVFLGSSFAFMPGLLTVFSLGDKTIASEYNAMALVAMLALLAAGLVYVILSVIIKYVGVARVRKLFPPIVVGPVIIIIGMNLAGSIFWNDIIVGTISKSTSEFGIVPQLSSSPDAWKWWTTALITAITIVGVNAFARPKSFVKVIPILLGFVVGYAYGACIGLVNIDFSGDIVIFQQAKELWGFWGAWADIDANMVATAMLSIVPIALVTFMEHLGDISANSTVCGQDFMLDPGLNRTVLGDGVATMASALLGGPANTTYGENTAVLAITKNYNPKNVALAAGWAVLLALFVPFGEILSAMPVAVVGGACVVLFGMIASNGLRALVEGKVDFSDSKNMLVVSITLSIGLGLGALSLAGEVLGSLTNYALDGNLLKLGFATTGGGFVSISSLAISTVVAIVLNLILPNSKPRSQDNQQAYNRATITLEANIVDIEDTNEN